MQEATIISQAMAHEQRLTLVGIGCVLVGMSIMAFIWYIKHFYDKRKEYMDTLDDEEYRKYREFLDKTG